MVSIRPIMSTRPNSVLKPAISRTNLKPTGKSKKLKDMGGPDPQANAKTAATKAALAGVAIGAAIGSVVPVVGTLGGAIFGGAIGGILGQIFGKDDND